MLVVGAGAAGLGAATALAGATPVVARRPPARCRAAARGADRPDVRAGVARGRAGRRRLALGATATRWEGGRLLVCAPGRDPLARRRDARLRRRPAARDRRRARPRRRPPGGRARGAPSPSALLETGTPPWRRAVVVGDGSGRGGGRRARPRGRRNGDRRGLRARLGRRARGRAGAPPRSPGRPRVTALRIERDGATATLACDAVLLAARPASRAQRRGRDRRRCGRRRLPPGHRRRDVRGDGAGRRRRRRAAARAGVGTCLTRAAVPGTR